MWYSLAVNFAKHTWEKPDLVRVQDESLARQGRMQLVHNLVGKSYRFAASIKEPNTNVKIQLEEVFVLLLNILLMQNIVLQYEMQNITMHEIQFPVINSAHTPPF